MSRKAKHPVSLRKVVEANEKNKDHTFVIVSKILDDETMFVIPKLRVVCLDISRTAREKILKFGGEIFTLEQLFSACEGLKNVTLLKEDKKARKCTKYFGACGEKGSTTYPKAPYKKRNGEKRLLK